MIPLLCSIILLLSPNTNIMTIKNFKSYLQEQSATPVTTQDPEYHKKFHTNLETQFGKEYPVIMTALKRNEIPDTDYDNVALAFSIRKAEAGKQGKEFGVLAPKAGMKPGETPEQTLDRQAGWAAATIVKNRKRFQEGGGKGDFIQFMGGRWAPIGVSNDPTNLNKNWVPNVSKFHKDYINCTGPNCKPASTPAPQQTAQRVQTNQQTPPTKKPKIK